MTRSLATRESGESDTPPSPPPTGSSYCDVRTRATYWSAPGRYGKSFSGGMVRGTLFKVPVFMTLEPKAEGPGRSGADGPVLGQGAERRGIRAE